MRYFTPEQSTATNRMWVNVRCYNIRQIPLWGALLAALLGLVLLWLIVHRFRLMRRIGQR